MSAHEVEKFIPVLARSRNGFLHKKFRTEAALHLPPKPLVELPGGDLEIEVEFHFLMGASGDIDNLLKPTIDALKGTMLRDDRQIKRLHAQIIETSDKQGIVVKLRKLNPRDFHESKPIYIEGKLNEVPIEEEVAPKSKKPKKKRHVRKLTLRRALASWYRQRWGRKAGGSKSKSSRSR